MSIDSSCFKASRVAIVSRLWYNNIVLIVPEGRKRPYVPYVSRNTLVCRSRRGGSARHHRLAVCRHISNGCTDERGLRRTHLYDGKCARSAKTHLNTTVHMPRHHSDKHHFPNMRSSTGERISSKHAFLSASYAQGTSLSLTRASLSGRELPQASLFLFRTTHIFALHPASCISAEHQSLFFMGSGTCSVLHASLYNAVAFALFRNCVFCIYPG